MTGQPVLMNQRKYFFFFNFNTAWLMYNLGSGEHWLLSRSLNYCNILQLDLFCQRGEKWDQILYAQAFITLHNKDEN